MNKKYSVLWIVVGMFLGFGVLAINIYVHNFCKSVLPILTYKNENSTEIILKYHVRNMFPILADINENRMIAKREDTFILKKIKPVELLTMMEVENMQESMETISIPEAGITDVGEEMLDKELIVETTTGRRL